MSSSRNAAVVRNYRAVPDDCARALQLLLKKPKSKAAEPTPEPDSRDDYERLPNKGRRPA
jgi:hypothetical protein